MTRLQDMGGLVTVCLEAFSTLLCLELYMAERCQPNDGQYAGPH